MLSNVIKEGNNFQLVRRKCEQDDNRDNNDEEEEDTNKSKVVHYQIRDEDESVIYTS